MKTTTHLAFILTAALAAHTYGGDAKVTLDSNNGASAFIVRDSASNVLTRVQSDGKVGIGVASPAYRLDVLGDINLTGAIYKNGVAWAPLTSYTENDPLFVASASYGITGTQVGNWNTAFGWGNHASAGYLTAYTETDPVFGASAAAGIAAADLAAWNAKLGGSGTANYVPAFTASGTVGNSALYSAANGNVGIGTTTPGSHVELFSALTTTPTQLGIFNEFLGKNTSGGDYEISTIKLGNRDYYSSVSAKIPNSLWSDAVRLDFSTPQRANNNTQLIRMSILPFSGNVGIGTTTPSLGLLQLTKTSGNDVNLVLEQSGVSTWDIRNMATSGNFGIYNGQLGTVSMAIDKANGNVGIGTGAPGYKLQVEGDIAIGDGGAGLTNPKLVLNTSSNRWFTQGKNGNYQISQDNGAGDVLTILPVSGNVGIGTTTPDYTLHVNGSVAGTSAYNNLSDSRLKKDVQPIGDALAIVGAMRGVTFNWDKTVDPAMKLDDRNHVGFLAQEVEAVLPQAVSTAVDARQTKSVAYSEVIPVLTEAIKQLKAENDTLKAQNAIILKRLDALEAK